MLGIRQRITALHQTRSVGAEHAGQDVPPSTPMGPIGRIARFVTRAFEGLLAFGAAALPFIFGFETGAPAAATAATTGAARGAVRSKGAMLSGHVLDAQQKYSEAKKNVTTSIAYAERGGDSTDTRGALEGFDRRANDIFEKIGNRHRSGKSRQNQRSKLDVLIAEMNAFSAELDR